MREPPVTIEKQMSISHAEFHRIVVGGLPAGERHVEGPRLVVADGERRLDITLSAEGHRQLGLLRLPITGVRLEFFGYDEAAVAIALADFDRAFQRGGG